MEQDKDQHLLCKQTGGLISFLVFKEFILQSSRSEMGAFYLCDGTSRAKEPASPLPGQQPTFTPYAAAMGMVGQEWEDPGGF